MIISYIDFHHKIIVFNLKRNLLFCEYLFQLGKSDNDSLSDCNSEYIQIYLLIFLIQTIHHYFFQYCVFFHIL